MLIPLCLLALAVSAGSQELDEARFMPVEQVRVGMRGVGKTVFSGTQIEEFQVEILGVLKNARPQGDLVLAKFSGGPLATSGMIQGMSGSPVYIDGKLLGAAAYGWAFAKEPICGITPIGEMLNMWQQMDEQDRGEEESSIGPINGAEDLSAEGALPGVEMEDLHAWPDPLAASLVPIKTPVMVSGFDQRVVAQMASVFQKYDMHPVQAGSGAEDDIEISLEPGASLAVKLVTGDVNLSAIGTLTYRRGDRVIGFGHPLFTAGGVDFPMAGAYVHSVMPSTATSFKLASATAPVGVLRQDRRQGVAGLIGRQPLTIPIDLKIHSRGGTGSKSFHFDIIDNKFFSPNLVTWVTLNTFLTTGEAMGDATVELEARFFIDHHADLHLKNVFSGSAPQAVLATELGEIVALLMRTHLGDVQLDSVGLDVTLQSLRREARIASVRTSKAVVEPGEEIQVTVFLEPYRGEERIVQAALQVPHDAPEGRLLLQITDAATSISWEQRRAPHRFQFRSVDQLLETLGGLETNDQLILKLIMQRRGAVIKGQELPSLPPSAMAVLRGSLQGGEGGVTHEEVLVEKRLQTEFVLSGQMALPLEVRR
jgi:hypothetical protein